MQRKEKQRKFHETLISILYPPPPSPPHQEEDDEEQLNTSRDGLNLDRIPDELEEEKCSSPSSDNEGGFGLQKLTRAQRKRLRKKKLKEADSCRKKRKIIGPLLPTSSDGGCCAVVKNEPQAVRQNAKQELDTRIDKPGEAAACANENKLKQRRMTKKLAKERSKLSVVEKNHQGEDPGAHNESST